MVSIIEMICIFMFTLWPIGQLGFGLDIVREGERVVVNKRQSEDSMGYWLQQPSSAASPNQRPTQFTLPTQALPTAHSRGALIMPPNNEIQTSNFHLSNYHHPSKHQLTSTESLHHQPSSGSSQSNISSSGGSRLSLLSPNSSSAGENQPSQQSSMRGFPQNHNIELALRHASSDESVFQPSPTLMVPSDHGGFDWPLRHQSSSPDLFAALSPSPSPPPPPQTNTNEGEQQESRSRSYRDDPIQLASTTSSSPTTEQNNNIAQNEAVSLPPTGQQQQTTMVVDSYLSPSNHGLEQQQQGPRGEFPSEAAVVAVEVVTNLSSAPSSPPVAPTELSNQVIYEGPITVAPSGDYYFSSSEKLPNNERASNAWWALGFGHEFDRASNLTRDNYLDYCTKSELVMSNKQKSLCRAHPKIMAIVARGLKMAIDECQSRFTSSRWNCSLVLQESLATNDQQLQQSPSRAQMFGDVMKHPNRERSFLNAIVAAGLAHAMTKACSLAELPEECSCDKRIKSKNTKGKIEWVACSDDIDFGARFSRDFTDTTSNTDSDTVAMINTHNYEVGRRVFKSATDITCTCQNGENGLCQTKRCWKHLGPFSDIGDELMKRYESATHVQLSNKDPHKLRPVRRGVRKPKRKDLVFIDESPDYCKADTRLGVLGTQNRHCNSTSLGSDSCSLLCCGRGYQVVVEEIEEDCNCKFVWCCQVKCDKCKRHVTNDVCN